MWTGKDGGIYRKQPCDRWVYFIAGRLVYDPGTNSIRKREHETTESVG